MLLPSTTGLVNRLGDGRVRKTHPATSGEIAGAQLEALMKDLHGHGLPVPLLLSRETMEDGTLITHWEDLGDSTTPIDYLVAGVMLRKFHAFKPVVKLPQLYN